MLSSLPKHFFFRVLNSSIVLFLSSAATVELFAEGKLMSPFLFATKKIYIEWTVKFRSLSNWFAN